MKTKRSIIRKLRLDELYQEAGNTLQRSPALFFCICLALAYVLHWDGGNGVGLWRWVELGVALVGALGYALLFRLKRDEISYLPSLFGYMAVAALCVLLCGLRLELSEGRRYGKATEVPTVAMTTLQALEADEVRPEVAAMLTGLSLGYIPRTLEGRQLRHSFVHSGLAHLLAVSGFHLAVVAGLLNLILLRLPIGGRGRIRRMIVLLGAWGFVALTGWAIPTVRAALMLSIYLIGRIITRPVQFGQLLSLTAAVQLLYDPYIIGTRSFTLSYAAVISIYFFYSYFFGLVGELRQPMLRWAWSAISVTLAAQLGVLPLCLYYFGTVSWSVLWLSLPTTLLSALLIPLSLLYSGLLNFGFNFSLLAALLGYLGETMLYVVEYGSQASILQVSLVVPQWGVCLWWGLLCICALWLKLPARELDSRLI